MAETYDIIIRNGRVMDPETGFDEVCDLAVSGDTIAKIGKIEGAAAREIDATGLIVAPGFIDLHAHGQSVAAKQQAGGTNHSGYAHSSREEFENQEAHTD